MGMQEENCAQLHTSLSPFRSVSDRHWKLSAVSREQVGSSRRREDKSDGMGKLRRLGALEAV
jgi:hypothetical protein